MQQIILCYIVSREGCRDVGLRKYRLKVHLAEQFAREITRSSPFTAFKQIRLIYFFPYLCSVLFFCFWFVFQKYYVFFLDLCCLLNGRGALKRPAR